MIHQARTQVVLRDPEILGGTPVFAGTRVPVQNLFDHLEAGDNLDSFLAAFPSVRREQVVAMLREMSKLLASAPRKSFSTNAWMGG